MSSNELGWSLVKNMFLFVSLLPDGTCGEKMDSWLTNGSGNRGLKEINMEFTEEDILSPFFVHHKSFFFRNPYILYVYSLIRKKYSRLTLFSRVYFRFHEFW